MRVWTPLGRKVRWLGALALPAGLSWGRFWGAPGLPGWVVGWGVLRRAVLTVVNWIFEALMADAGGVPKLKPSGNAEAPP